MFLYLRFFNGQLYHGLMIPIAFVSYKVFWIFFFSNLTLLYLRKILWKICRLLYEFKQKDTEKDTSVYNLLWQNSQ